MKIEQIIILHLYNTKQVTLQGIGTLKLNPAFSLPENSNGKIMFQNDAITFEPDPKVTQDYLLIDAIVQHTKKIKPLATSDLDSFIMAGKELLTLNNPFILKGIGSIVKTQNGAFKFVPELFAPAKLQKLKAAPKNKPVSVSFKNYTAILSKSKKPLVIIVVISVAGLTVLNLMNFFIKKKSNEKSTVQTQNLPNTHTDIIKSADTVKTGQVINTSKASDNDKRYTFKIVFFQTTNHEEALKKLNDITGFGHSPFMYKSDSLYKVAMAFGLPLSDTLHIKDSLDQFYSLGKGFVEVE